LLVDLRTDVVGAHLDKKAWRAGFRAFAEVTKRAWLWEMGVRTARLGRRLRKRGAAVRDGVGPLGEWTESRNLPELAEVSFRELWRTGIRSVDPRD
jgi:hypothetical protein